MVCLGEPTVKGHEHGSDGMGDRPGEAKMKLAFIRIVGLHGIVLQSV